MNSKIIEYLKVSGIAGVVGGVVAIVMTFYDIGSDLYDRGEKSGSKTAVINTQLENLTSQLQRLQQENDATKKNAQEINLIYQKISDIETSQQSGSPTSLAVELKLLKKQINELADRVATLQSNNHTSATAVPTEEIVSNIKPELLNLVKQEISKIPASNSNLDSSRPIVIQSDFSGEFETQYLDSGGFEAGIMGCNRANKKVACDFLVKHNEDRINLLWLNSGPKRPKTRAVLQNGTSLLSSGMMYNSKSFTGTFEKRFSPDAPSKVTLNFNRVPEGNDGFLWLEFETGRGMLRFKNVPIN